MKHNSGPFGPQNSIFYGAILLTLGSIVIRFVQMVFQIYISGIMGAAGLGRMQLIMAVGGLASVIASGGVRIAATCLAAEEAGRDSAAGVRSAIRCCCLYGGLLSTLAAAALYLLSHLLSAHWIDDPSAALPLRLFALGLPLNCLWSVLAGYYTAASRITELVLLEFAERLGSIGLVILLLRTNPGASDPCAAVILGSTLATLVSFLILLERYYRSISQTAPSPLRPMMGRLLRLTLPLGCNDILRSGLGTLEQILVPQGLRKSGSSGPQSLASYGTICGMVFPVITFPSVILYSLSDLLVPEMARSRAKGWQPRILFLTEKCLRLTMLFAAATAGLCFLLGDDLGMLLFGSRDAGIYLRIFAPLILILYIDTITDGMLKGLSQQLHSVRYNTFTSLLDVLLIYLLLPRCGIRGFLIAFTLSHGVNFFLSLRRLILVTGYLPRFRATLTASGCCVLCLLLFRHWPGAGLGGVFLRGCCFLLSYLLLIRLTGALKAEDLRWLRSLVAGH